MGKRTRFALVAVAVLALGCARSRLRDVVAVAESRSPASDPVGCVCGLGPEAAIEPRAEGDQPAGEPEEGVATEGESAARESDGEHCSAGTSESESAQGEDGAKEPAWTEIPSEPCTPEQLFAPEGRVFLDYVDGRMERRRGWKPFRPTSDQREWLSRTIEEKLAGDETGCASGELRVWLEGQVAGRFTGQVPEEWAAVASVKMCKGDIDNDWDYQIHVVVVSERPGRAVLAHLKLPGTRNALRVLASEDVDGDGFDDLIVAADLEKMGVAGISADLLSFRGGRVRRVDLGLLAENRCGFRGRYGAVAARLFLTASVPRQLTKVNFEHSCFDRKAFPIEEGSFQVRLVPDVAEIQFLDEFDFQQITE